MRYLKRCQKFAQRKQSKSKKYHSFPKAKQERKLHVKVANIRQDYLHKESTKLVKNILLLL
ncbi:hypothetical protein AXG55_08145 [Silvanigrella aquatica]|uniref:Uncharacterized protein n=2 Tax=Silvanigrella aquatica TaxID=1915309 RepID=A0A1L4D111_9BACT|nr:hypothetical protein AXG55_08145 [Silvanigrella aquatica]